MIALSAGSSDTLDLGTTTAALPRGSAPSDPKGVTMPAGKDSGGGRRTEWHDEEERLLFVLPQELSGRGAARRRPGRRLYLRRVH